MYLRFPAVGRAILFIASLVCRYKLYIAYIAVQLSCLIRHLSSTKFLRFWSELDLPCSARIVENVDNVENVRRSQSERPRNMGSPTNGPDCIPLVHAWDRRCRKPMIRWNLAWRTRPSDRALGEVLMHFHLPRWKMFHWSKTTWYAVPSWTWTAFATTAGLRVADVASLMLSITHLWPPMLFCWRQNTFLQQFTIRVYRYRRTCILFNCLRVSIVVSQRSGTTGSHITTSY